MNFVLRERQGENTPARTFGFDRRKPQEATVDESSELVVYYRPLGAQRFFKSFFKLNRRGRRKKNQHTLITTTFLKIIE